MALYRCVYYYMFSYVMNASWSVFVCLSAYDGPYENSPESPKSPESHVTKIKVTPDSTRTEETDSDNDIPTIPTGHS